MAQREMYYSILALSVGDSTGEAHLGSSPQTEYKAGNVREIRNLMTQEIPEYLPCGVRAPGPKETDRQCGIRS